MINPIETRTVRFTKEDKSLFDRFQLLLDKAQLNRRHEQERAWRSSEHFSHSARSCGSAKALTGVAHHVGSRHRYHDHAGEDPAGQRNDFDSIKADGWNNHPRSRAA